MKHHEKYRVAVPQSAPEVRGSTGSYRAPSSLNFRSSYGFQTYRRNGDDGCAVFVGNLAPDTTTEQLAQAFAEFGQSRPSIVKKLGPNGKSACSSTKFIELTGLRWYQYLRFPQLRYQGTSQCCARSRGQCCPSISCPEAPTLILSSLSFMATNSALSQSSLAIIVHLVMAMVLVMLRSR